MSNKSMLEPNPELIAENRRMKETASSDTNLEINRILYLTSHPEQYERITNLIASERKAAHEEGYKHCLIDYAEILERGSKKSEDSRND